MSVQCPPDLQPTDELSAILEEELCMHVVSHVLESISVTLVAYSSIQLLVSAGSSRERKKTGNYVEVWAYHPRIMEQLGISS